MCELVGGFQELEINVIFIMLKLCKFLHACNICFQNTFLPIKFFCPRHFHTELLKCHHFPFQENFISLWLLASGSFYLYCIGVWGHTCKTEFVTVYICINQRRIQKIAKGGSICILNWQDFESSLIFIGDVIISDVIAEIASYPDAIFMSVRYMYAFWSTAKKSLLLCW